CLGLPRRLRVFLQQSLSKLAEAQVERDKLSILINLQNPPPVPSVEPKRQTGLVMPKHADRPLRTVPSNSAIFKDVPSGVESLPKKNKMKPLVHPPRATLAKKHKVVIRNSRPCLRNLINLRLRERSQAGQETAFRIKPIQVLVHS